MTNKKRKFDPRARDKHHLLWPKNSYARGYAKALRSHNWLKMQIPRDTLHREIHAKLSCIPTPTYDLCKRAYLELVRLDKEGKLNYHARLEDRVAWLMDFWSIEEAPRTVLALREQWHIVHDFYRGGAR